MKVCVISTYPPTHCGMAHYVHLLCEELNNEGVHASVLANDEAKKVGRVKVTNAWRYDDTLSAFKVFQVASRLRAEIIQIHHEYLLYGSPVKSTIFMFLLLPLLKLLRKPIVVMVHSVVAKDSMSPLFLEYGLTHARFLSYLVLIFFMKYICILADKVIVYTNLAKRILCEDYGIATEKIVVIQHGAPKVKIIKDAKEKLGLQGKKVLVFFGFLRPKKGLEYLVEAALKARMSLPNLVVLIVGGTHERMPDVSRSLHHYCQEKRADFIFFTGFVPEEELPIYFSAADAFIFSYNDSIASASGAMHMILGYGKAIIATNIPKFCELREAEAGIIVPPNDSDALCNAIVSVFKNASIAKRILSFHNRRLWNKVARKFIEVYREIIS